MRILIWFVSVCKACTFNYYAAPTKALAREKQEQDRSSWIIAETLVIAGSKRLDSEW